MTARATTRPSASSTARPATRSLFLDYPGRDDALLFDAGENTALDLERLGDLEARLRHPPPRRPLHRPRPDRPREPRPRQDPPRLRARTARSARSTRPDGDADIGVPQRLDVHRDSVDPREDHRGNRRTACVDAGPGTGRSAAPEGVRGERSADAAAASRGAVRLCRDRRRHGRVAIHGGRTDRPGSADSGRVLDLRRCPLCAPYLRQAFYDIEIANDPPAGNIDAIATPDKTPSSAVAAKKLPSCAAKPAGLQSFCRALRADLADQIAAAQRSAAIAGALRTTVDRETKAHNHAAALRRQSKAGDRLVTDLRAAERHEHAIGARIATLIGAHNVTGQLSAQRTPQRSPRSSRS